MVTSAIYSNNDSLIASASTDKTIRIWDAQNGMLKKIMPIGGLVIQMAFNPNDNLLATSILGKDTILIWDVNTGKLVKSMFSGSRPYAVQFSSDGKELYTY